MIRTALPGTVLAGALALTGVLALPSTAHAATTTDAAGFATDAEGWTPTSGYAGLCLPALLCPSVTPTYVASGGIDGADDGYLSTSFMSLASTLAGTTTSGWLSPAFTYDGVNGLDPTSLTLDLAKKVSLGGLLGLDVLNDSSYQVDLVDVATGEAVTAVPRTALTNDDSWSVVPPASINPDRLTKGHSYQVRLSTTYHSAATVVASGEVGYDDLRLTASRTPENGPVDPGTTTVVYLPGPRTTVVTNPPVNPMSTRVLRQYVLKTGLPSKVKLVGKHLRFQVSCLAISTPKGCKYSIDALTAGKGSPAATARTIVRVPAGGSKVVSLTIRPRQLARYRGAKAARTAYLRAKVRSGVFKVTVVKRVRIQG
jgi:hypothetical protein